MKLQSKSTHSAMFCLCNNLSINKPIVVTNATLPQNPDSSPPPPPSSSTSPKQTNLPQNKKPSLGSKNSTTPLPPNKLRRRPSPSSLMQIERALGAGSFRDGEPDFKYALLPLPSVFTFSFHCRIELVSFSVCSRHF